MNNRRIIINACLILLLGVIWFFWRSDAPQPKQPVEKIQNKEERASTTNVQLDGDRRLSGLDYDGVKKPEGMSDADWQRAIRIHSIKDSANRSVNFYGKVVDQHDEPVEGVKLELKVLSYQDSFIDYFKTGREQIKNRFTMFTDKNGIFSVEQKKGTSFAIEKMTKNGYIIPDRGTKYNFIYSNLSSGEQSSMYHSPDKSQPVIYKMWKSGETEPLIKTGTRLMVEPAKGVNEAYYPFILNGKPSGTPMSGWDIKVTGKNVRSQDKRKPEDDYWEVTLTAGEGGGFVLTDTPHANLAPNEGYQKSLTFKSTDQTSLKDSSVRRAYYRGQNGEKYAAFRFELGIGSRKQKGRFHVTFANLRINPNGSRNLEYDSSKRIK
jgi:hypothetical protein